MLRHLRRAPKGSTHLMQDAANKKLDETLGAQVLSDAIWKSS